MALFDWSSQVPDTFPTEWIATKGRGVKIAFIDTGVDVSVPALKHLDRNGRKFFTGRTDFSPANLSGVGAMTDSFPDHGHGTLYASLMAGRADENPEGYIQGIASESEYFIIKASRNNIEHEDSVRDILLALELACNLDVDIVISGISLLKTNLRHENIPSAEVERVEQLISKKKLLVFCALKNWENWSGIVARTVPNSLSTVHSIALAPRQVSLNWENIQKQPIPFLLSGVKGKVHTRGGHTIDLTISNSCAVAIMGALAALCMSHLKSQNGPSWKDPDQVLQQISACCPPLTESAGSENNLVVYSISKNIQV
jgi:hypothetical protein